MKWPEFIRRKRNAVSYENVTCQNCETHFSGHFCPNCGQSVNEYDKPFSFIFYNFLGDFFAFDTRFFTTFFYMVFKPGFLSEEYFAGRRVRYTPPFRIFIFVSFVLFFLLQITTNRGIVKVLDTSFPEEGELAVDSISVSLADSIIKEVVGSTGIAPKDTTATVELNGETFSGVSNARGVLGKLAEHFDKKLEREEDPLKKTKWRKYSQLCRMPEQAVAQSLKYMSWAFFLLLPFFALILKLFYIHQRKFYMRHLVFSIHLHSFIFIAYSLVLAAYLVFNVNISYFILFVIFFWVPIYSVLALKKFYVQGLGKTLVKFTGICVLYNFVFWAVVITVFIEALNIT